MATSQYTGKKGEDLAMAYLQAKGFSILHRNWRHSHCEIDLVASRRNVLHFVEVKTRRSHRFGFPEEAVSPQKMHRLFSAAEAYLNQFPHWKTVQYDIVAITLLPQAAPEIKWIQDVYLWE